jgi:hypothetical protein
VLCRCASGAAVAGPPLVAGACVAQRLDCGASPGGQQAISKRRERELRESGCHASSRAQAPSDGASDGCLASADGQSRHGRGARSNSTPPSAAPFGKAESAGTLGMAPLDREGGSGSDSSEDDGGQLWRDLGGIDGFSPGGPYPSKHAQQRGRGLGSCLAAAETHSSGAAGGQKGRRQDGCVGPVSEAAATPAGEQPQDLAADAGVDLHATSSGSSAGGELAKLRRLFGGPEAGPGASSRGPQLDACSLQGLTDAERADLELAVELQREELSSQAQRAQPWKSWAENGKAKGWSGARKRSVATAGTLDAFFRPIAKSSRHASL